MLLDEKYTYWLMGRPYAVLLALAMYSTKTVAWPRKRAGSARRR